MTTASQLRSRPLLVVWPSYPFKFTRQLPSRLPHSMCRRTFHFEVFILLPSALPACLLSPTTPPRFPPLIVPRKLCQQLFSTKNVAWCRPLSFGVVSCRIRFDRNAAAAKPVL